MKDRSSFDISQHSQHIESKIVVALERISQAFRVLLWKESKASSLSPIQIQILTFLLFHSSEKCKISYLANEFNMTKATVSDSVKLLFQKKLVERVRDSADNRSFSIALTAEGNQVAGNVSSFAGLIERSVHRFTDARKQTLLINLLQLIQNLHMEEVITVQRMCLSCRFYRKDKHVHYCGLLKKKLLTGEMAVDCPEHQLAL